MSYEHTISQVVKVVEAVGAGIMVFGGLGALLVFASRALHSKTAHESYDELRRNLGRCILVGLEVLIIADIVRTIIVDPTIESVAVLGIIVGHPDRSQFLARGGDRRRLAVAPVAARAQPERQAATPRQP